MRHHLACGVWLLAVAAAALERPEVSAVLGEGGADGRYKVSFVGTEKDVKTARQALLKLKLPSKNAAPSWSMCHCPIVLPAFPAITSLHPQKPRPTFPDLMASDSDIGPNRRTAFWTSMNVLAPRGLEKR